MHVGKSYFDYQENALIPQLGFLYSKLTKKIELDNRLSPTEQKLLITLLLHTKG
ncbi:hypothetical protein HK235_02005, partial [Streptococcus agalactiae]|nr:hypothetical protein [Streptococcus agalactiae]